MHCKREFDYGKCILSMIGIHRCIFLFDFSITMGAYSQLLSNYTVVDHNQKKLSYSSENVSADMLNGALPWEQHAERGQSCPLFESVQRNTISSGFMNRIHTSSLIVQL